MTNREKFFNVFKIYPEQINEVDWDEKYHTRNGLQVYECEYTYVPSDPYIFEEFTEVFEVVAGSAEEARKKAIKKLGPKYRRYLGSGRPMYPLYVKKKPLE